MLEPKVEQGASPGLEGEQNPVDPNQTSQPAIETPAQDQPADKNPLESLYQLSENDRNAIMALPEEVRVPAVAALNNARVSQEQAYTERLERGRQAEENLEILYKDPSFRDFLTGASPQPPVAQPAAPPPSSIDLTETYGEQANGFLNEIVRRVGQDVDNKLAGLNTTVNGLQSSIVQNEQERNWGALEEFAKDNNLPDPNEKRSQIAMLRRNNPNITLDSAYQATLDLRNLATRNPVTAPPEQRNAPAPNEPPGRSNSSAVPNTETQKLDPTEEAIRRRKAGETLNMEEEFAKGFEKSVEAYNAQNGTSFSADDFTR